MKGNFVNISAVNNISFTESRYKHKKYHSSSRLPRRDFNEAKQRRSGEIRKEISSLEEKLSAIAARKEKFQAEIDKPDNSPINASLKSLAIDDITYLNYVEDSLKVRIALLKSQL